MKNRIILNNLRKYSDESKVIGQINHINDILYCKTSPSSLLFKDDCVMNQFQIFSEQKEYIYFFYTKYQRSFVFPKKQKHLKRILMNPFVNKNFVKMIILNFNRMQKKFQTINLKCSVHDDFMTQNSKKLQNQENQLQNSQTILKIINNLEFKDDHETQLQFSFNETQKNLKNFLDYMENQKEQNEKKEKQDQDFQIKTQKIDAKFIQEKTPFKRKINNLDLNRIQQKNIIEKNQEAIQSKFTQIKSSQFKQSHCITSREYFQPNQNIRQNMNLQETQRNSYQQNSNGILTDRQITKQTDMQNYIKLKQTQRIRPQMRFSLEFQSIKLNPSKQNSIQSYQDKYHSHVPLQKQSRIKSDHLLN